MTKDRAGMLWFGLALAAGLAAAPGLFAGGFALPPLFLAVVGLACAAHRPSRAFVTDTLGEVFSGSRMRSLVIVFGAILMIQILPMELALLMAGDVLAYVEVVAAVSLIAGQARWPLLKARIAGFVRDRVARANLGLGRRPVARARRAALRRRPRPPSSGVDDAAAPWGLAFA
ncbi:hypothetical protein D3C72_1561930 [compost metagenome]